MDKRDLNSQHCNQRNLALVIIIIIVVVNDGVYIIVVKT